MATFLQPHMTKSLCRYCGSEEVTYNSATNDDYCASCGGWQNERYPIISYLCHKWYVLFIDDQHYSHLARVSWRGQLRQRGQVARVITAKISPANQ
jgi:ribosomal protein L37E